MFSDSDTTVTGFESHPETERLVCDGSSQTQSLKTSNKETQTSGKTTSGTQAETSGFGAEPPPYDCDKLLKFLKKIVPKLEEELKDLDGDKDQFSFNEQSILGLIDKDHLEPVQSLSKYISIQPDYCKGKVITGLTWNSTGMLFALCYSTKNHEGWCCHETTVGIYNIGKSEFEKHPPKHLLKASACVRCIKFHPYVPSLLAGGFHSGEVVIWDLTTDDALMTNIKGSGDEGGHADAVTCLTWREDRNGVRLVSTGRDGKVIFWKVAVTNLTYEAHERFLIFKDQTTADVASHRLEVASVSFWPNKDSDFVIAAGDRAFHCSLTMATPLTSAPGYKNPVSMNYAPHEGIVTSVACSPVSDMFASSGIDSKIQVFRFRIGAPLHVIRRDSALMGLEWKNDVLIPLGRFHTLGSFRVGEKEVVDLPVTVFEIDGEVSAMATSSSKFGKTVLGSTLGEVFITNSSFPLA